MRLKMKKITFILIILFSIILVIFVGWYFFLRDPAMPVGEAVRNILPFGSGERVGSPLPPLDTIDDSGTGIVSPDEFGIPTADLFRISDTPVAGMVTFTRNNQTVVRYADRGTGHIYDAVLPTEAGSTALEKIKVSNQTLPKIYEAYFRSDGNAVLFRSLRDDSDTAENLSLILTPPRATSTALYNVSSTLLRGDMTAVAVGSGDTLFYALRDTSSIISSAFNGAGTRTLFSSAFNNWRLTRAGNNLVIYTKASAKAPGYAYTLNVSGGTPAKILGPLNGLVVVPDVSGNKILYSYIENGKTRLFVRNTRGQNVSEISPATIAEKCAWGVRSVNLVFCGSPVNSTGLPEPDGWYRGASHFSDNIWLFNTDIQTAQVLAEPKPTLGIDIDVYEPRLSPNEDFLIFINKTDFSLWALRLKLL